MAYDAEIEPKSKTLILLEKAREINAKQWGRYSIHSMCMAGAINMANHGDEFYGYQKSDEWKVADMKYFDDAQQALGFKTIGALCDWNNSQKSVESVLARYDAAIARLSVKVTA